MKISRRLAAICSMAIITSIVYFSCKPKKSAVEPFFRNLHDTVSYVGIETCKTCHTEHYETFIQTGMGQSFGPADPARSKADFKNIKPVYDSIKNLYYFPFKRDGKIFIREFRLKNGDTVHQRTEEIKWIVGSGHHTNSHFWMDGDFLYQAPLTFYTQSQKWDLPPGYETNNTGFSRKIDIECMSCHNAMPVVDEKSVNKFIKLPSGIDCERCHGPGSLHVAEKRQGKIVDTKKQADRSIVNPARLPWKLQVDICQRCHLQGNNVLKPGKKFTDFRPGMHLDSVFEIYMPKYENSDVFYMAGHAERLQMSKCFIQSNAAGSTVSYNPKLNLTCITCHNPHVSVRKTNNAVFNNACKQCHGENGNAAKVLCSANAQERNQNNDNCVQCHMPGSGTGDIPHVTVHDHYIRKPSAGKAVNTGKAIGLYAVNNKKPEKEMLFKAYVSWFEKWEAKPFYLEKAAELSSAVTAENRIHLNYAKGLWTDITKASAEINADDCDAWTCYRIAKANDKSGRLDEALSWYRKAAEKMPFHFDFAAELGNALIRSGNNSEAIQLLQSAQKIQAKHEMILVNLGTAYYQENKPAEALRYWLQAVSLNPDNENTRLFLGELYIKTGNNRQAAVHLQEAVRINPANATAKEMLKKLQITF
jgi:tetratricopeptide (TPR) repeat protein